MSIRLQWDNNDDRVLYQIFEEGWTLQAYYHSIAALDAMTANHDRPIYLVMDLSNVSGNRPRETHGRRFDEAHATRNLARVLLVSPGYFMPNVNCPVDVVDSREAALDMLNDVQQKIPA